MAFSKKSLDFLFENRLHDSKQWYQEHKDQYIELVTEPFAAFIEGMEPVMKEIDSKIICNPKKISRIYRDARYAKGGSIFRENIWYTFTRPRAVFQELPSFYFGIFPEGFSYGCGYYKASTASMGSLRKLILDNDSDFVKAQKAYINQDVFTLEGEFYKKNRYPGESEDRYVWLNRKTLYLEKTSDDIDRLSSEKLAEEISQEFRSIAPVYHFLMKAEDILSQQQYHI